jgi:hypothetical protein
MLAVIGVLLLCLGMYGFFALRIAMVGIAALLAVGSLLVVAQFAKHCKTLASSEAPKGVLHGK